MVPLLPALPPPPRPRPHLPQGRRARAQLAGLQGPFSHINLHFLYFFRPPCRVKLQLVLSPPRVTVLLICSALEYEGENFQRCSSPPSSIGHPGAISRGPLGSRAAAATTVPVARPPLLHGQRRARGDSLDDQGPSDLPSRLAYPLSDSFQVFLLVRFSSLAEGVPGLAHGGALASIMDHAGTGQLVVRLRFTHSSYRMELRCCRRLLISYRCSKHGVSRSRPLQRGLRRRSLLQSCGDGEQEREETLRPPSVVGQGRKSLHEGRGNHHQEAPTATCVVATQRALWLAQLARSPDAIPKPRRLTGRCWPSLRS